MTTVLINTTTVFIAVKTDFIAPGCRLPLIQRRSSWQRRRSPARWRRSSRKRGAGILENTLGFLSIFLDSPFCFPGYPILREFSFVGMSGIPVKRLTNSRLFLFSKWTVFIYATKSAVLVCKGQSESVQLFDWNRKNRGYCKIYPCEIIIDFIWVRA